MIKGLDARSGRRGAAVEHLLGAAHFLRSRSTQNGARNTFTVHSVMQDTGGFCNYFCSGEGGCS